MGLIASLFSSPGVSFTFGAVATKISVNQIEFALTLSLSQRVVNRHRSHDCLIKLGKAGKVAQVKSIMTYRRDP